MQLYLIKYVSNLWQVSSFAPPVKLICHDINRTELFLAHLAFRPCELLSSLFVRRLSSVVRQHFTF